MNPPRPAPDEIRQALKKVFGHRGLRPGQKEVIDSVLSGQDTLAVLPTGAGKSLCYQLPGHTREGSTLIVSPLISLMRDQAEKLEEVGLEVDQVNSSLTVGEEDEALERIGSARTDFIFATPERMEDPAFLTLLQSSNVTLFVVDEAHCISQWGHDFRPAYLHLRQALEALGHPTVLALTATATEDVTRDICQQLGMRSPRVIHGSVYRDNLRYGVRAATSEPEKLALLLEEVRRHEGPGIIYCATVKAVEQVMDHLASAGEPAVAYHGRLNARTRAENQDSFMEGRERLMVATNAFGMGIDKPDIRFIIHFQVPGKLEAYYQETGRAGRDGDKSCCTLLYYPNDKRIQQFFLIRRFPNRQELESVHRELQSQFEDGGPVEAEAVSRHLKPAVSLNKTRVALQTLLDAGVLSELDGRYRPAPGAARPDYAALSRPWEEKDQHDREALEQMLFFAQTGFCRWQVLMAHFGEDPEWEQCGHCDNCEHPPEEQLTQETPSTPVTRPEEAKAQPARISEGMEVLTARSGRGKVLRVEDGKAILELEDGSTRTFLLSHVQPA